jgi:hypothetical protein
MRCAVHKRRKGGRKVFGEEEALQAYDEGASKKDAPPTGAGSNRWAGEQRKEYPGSKVPIKAPPGCARGFRSEADAASTSKPLAMLITSAA